MIFTVGLFVVVLGILVFIHEAGHFVTARRNGITCHEFGFGFPPRLGGVYKDAKTGKWKLVLGNKEYMGNKTLYSFNWIPLGGFVRIKGEDGENKDSDSFASKSTWVRFKVLSGGVFMNFVLAWVLFSVVAMFGTTELASNQSKYAKIIDKSRVQINTVEEKGNDGQKSPAAKMGLSMGNFIEKICVSGSCYEIASVEDLVSVTKANAGKEISIYGIAGKEKFVKKGILRKSEEGTPLGISIAQTVKVTYPPHIALWKGLERTGVSTYMTFSAFGQMITSLISGNGMPAGLNVAGPVGIAEMTGKAFKIGFTTLLVLMAMLSLNLGIINILPIPALDGGRILFLLIEKIKGSPVDAKLEGYIHGISFFILIALMLLVTAKDILRFF